MPLETATYINELNSAYPLGVGEPKSLGDDHMRLIKSTLQNTFPNLTGAVTATHSDLNVIAAANPGTLPAVNGSNITNLNASALASGTVADARLSSNVPLKNAANEFSATAGGIGSAISLTGSSAGVLRWSNSASGANEKNTEVLTTGGQLIIRSRTDAEGSGANLLAANRNGAAWDSLALAATSITLNGVNVTDYARLSQSNAFTGSIQTISGANARVIVNNTGGGVNEKAGTLIAVGGHIQLRALQDDLSGVVRTFLDYDVANDSLALAGSVLTYGGLEVGYRGLPTWSSGDQNGKVRELTSSIQLNTGGIPGAVNVYYNNSDSAVNLNQGSGLTLRLGGTTATGNRTILPRGFATLWVRGSTEYVVTGHVS